MPGVEVTFPKGCLDNDVDAYLKVLYADYDKNFIVLEFIGEWNDCIYNDVMQLKRNVIDLLIGKKKLLCFCLFLPKLHIGCL